MQNVDYIFLHIVTLQERRKDLTEHRDDSTFSFDPSKIPVKQLEKENKRKIDSRKGLLLSSYTRKRTRRRKRRGIESPTHSRNDSSQEPQEGGAPKDNNCESSLLKRAIIIFNNFYPVAVEY